MTLAPIDYLIWVSWFVLCVALIRILKGRPGFHLATLRLFLYFSAYRSVALFAVLKFTPHAYPNAYWAMRPLGFILVVALSVEICCQVAGGRWGAFLRISGVLVGLLYLYCYFSFGERYQIAVLVFSRLSAILRCGLFFMAVAVGKRWPWPLRGIAAGFGLSAALSLAVSALGVFLGPPSWDCIRRLLPLCEVIGLATWAYALSVHFEPRQSRGTAVYAFNRGFKQHSMMLRAAGGE